MASIALGRHARSRWVGDLLRRALAAMPVVVVTGARQTGKTTLVRDLLGDPQRPFLSLDDLSILEQAEREPDSLLAEPPLTIDEVQRAPALLLAIKRRVDRQRSPGMIIVTGSANLSLMGSVFESLAGRALYLELPPFCPLEWQGASAGDNPLDRLFKPRFTARDWPTGGGDWRAWRNVGGYPPALQLADEDARRLWLGGYVQTYLERDLRQLSDVSSLPDFQRVMRLLAHRAGKLLNQSELARDAGLKQPTVHRYLNLLETGYQISRVPTFASNPAIPIVKAKKVFFNDCGLAAYLAGGSSPDSSSAPGLEQTFFQTLLAWRACSPLDRQIFYWRDRLGNEVDFVLQEGERIVALEIKASSQIGTRELAGLHAFAAAVGKGVELVRSAIVCTVEAPRSVAEGVHALPVGCFFPPGLEARGSARAGPEPKGHSGSDRPRRRCRQD